MSTTTYYQFALTIPNVPSGFGINVPGQLGDKIVNAIIISGGTVSFPNGTDITTAFSNIVAVASGPNTSQDPFVGPYLIVNNPNVEGTFVLFFMQRIIP